MLLPMKFTKKPKRSIPLIASAASVGMFGFISMSSADRSLRLSIMACPSFSGSGSSTPP